MDVIESLKNSSVLKVCPGSLSRRLCTEKLGMLSEKPSLLIPFKVRSIELLSTEENGKQANVHFLQSQEFREVLSFLSIFEHLMWKKSEQPLQKFAGKFFLILLQQVPHFLLSAKIRSLHWFSEKSPEKSLKRPKRSLSSTLENGKVELMHAPQVQPELPINSA